MFSSKNHFKTCSRWAAPPLPLYAQVELNSLLLEIHINLKATSYLLMARFWCVVGYKTGRTCSLLRIAFFSPLGGLLRCVTLGIPANLTELGGTDPDMDWLVSSALKDPSVGGNPVEMTPENTRSLFEACL